MTQKKAFQETERNAKDALTMIPLTIIYQTDFVVIEVNQDLGFIQTTWLQQPSSEMFRQETRRLVDYALEHNLTLSLFDVRKRDFLDLSDQNWVVRDVLPMFKSNTIRLAYLVSPAGLEIMDTFQIHHRVINTPELRGHIEVEIFLDKEDALRWLSEVRPIC